MEGQWASPRDIQGRPSLLSRCCRLSWWRTWSPSRRPRQITSRSSWVGFVVGPMPIHNADKWGHCGTQIFLLAMPPAGPLNHTLGQNPQHSYFAPYPGRSDTKISFMGGLGPVFGLLAMPPAPPLKNMTAGGGNYYWCFLTICTP